MTVVVAHLLNAQGRYQIRNATGSFHGSATALNNRGQIVGEYVSSNGSQKGFIYDGTTADDFAPMGDVAIRPLAINDAGQIVGVTTLADFSVRAFLYSNGQAVLLALPSGADNSAAVAINRAGLVAGWAHRLPGELATAWNAEPVMLGSLGSSFTRAQALNNNGDIVGSSALADFTPSHAFLYRKGTMVDLGTGRGRGSVANAINDKGTIAGTITFADSTRHATVWIDGLTIDLGTLGGPNSEARGINSAGTVIGSSYSTARGGIHAFVCVNGVMVDLNDLADLKAAGVNVLQEAIAINDHGEILCNGNSVSGATSFLLTPVGGASRLVNFSLLAKAGQGEQTLIVGFVVQGEGRPLLIRASGPALSSFGITAPLADPNLTLLSGGATVGANEDWSLGGNSTIIAETAALTGAFSFLDGSKDAALVDTLPAGNYTVQTDSRDRNGIALIEVYEAGLPTGTGYFANGSGRARVGSGDDSVIMGFVIAGEAPKTVLMRAIGPALSRFGITSVLADPQFTVFDKGIAIAANDNWEDTGTASTTTMASASAGAFPVLPGSKDAALVLTLQPGAYTVQISGADSTVGVALVEIYSVF